MAWGYAVAWTRLDAAGFRRAMDAARRAVRTDGAARDGETGTMAKLTRAELASRIDRLGALRRQLHELSDEEKAVAADVRAALEARADGKAAGEAFVAALVPTRTTEIADLPGLARAAGKRLLEIVTIRLTEARRVLGADAVAAHCREVAGTKLTVQPLR